MFRLIFCKGSRGEFIYYLMGTVLVDEEGERGCGIFKCIDVFRVVFKYVIDYSIYVIDGFRFVIDDEFLWLWNCYLVFRCFG